MAGWYKPSPNSTYFRFMTVYGIGFPHYSLQKIQQTLDEKSRSSSCKPLGCYDPSSLVVLGGCSSRFGTGTSYSNVHTTEDGFTRKNIRYKLGCATSSDRIIGCIEKGLRVCFFFFLLFNLVNLAPGKVFHATSLRLKAPHPTNGTYHRSW